MKMVRSKQGATNVTVREGLIDIIEEEIVSPGYLGYTSHAEVIHDAGRLLVLLVTFLKLTRGESINNDQVAMLIAALRKVGAGLG